MPKISRMGCLLVKICADFLLRVGVSRLVVITQIVVNSVAPQPHDEFLADPTQNTKQIKHFIYRAQYQDQNCFGRKIYKKLKK